MIRKTLSISCIQHSAFSVKRSALIAFFCIISTSLFSQYYYNDILSNMQSNKNYSVMKDAAVKTVTVTHYNNNDELQTDLKIEQTFSKDYTTLESKTTSSDKVRPMLLFNHYENNKIVKTEDTHDSVNTIVNYKYNNNGLLENIVSYTNDTTIASESLESHQWFYNERGRVIYMLKIKNKKDTTKIELVYDKDSLITEENWFRKGKVMETYYYYYNDKKQLTDIVRFNNRAKRLLPDYLFEYDALNNVQSMTQVPAGSSNYLIWQYIYTDKGLKKQDNCFTKQRQLIGKMKYEYGY